MFVVRTRTQDPGEPASVTAAQTVRMEGAAFGTRWHVAVVGDALEPEALAATIEAVLATIDAQMSTYREDSTLQRLNRSPVGTWVEVSPQLLEVFELARAVHDASEGAFDPTVGRLVRAWGFGPDARPDRAPDIAPLMDAVGMRHLESRAQPPSIRRLHPEVELDLSAIAKGYAVDRVLATVLRAGHARVMVEIGGEVAVAGSGPSGGPWRIGIETPRASLDRSALEAVALERGGLATSGEYRNRYALEGRQVSHTLDPRTGRPIDHATASVSVHAPSCALADAWATALNVAGPDRARDLSARAGIEFLLVVARGDSLDVVRSAGFPDPVPR